MLKVIIIKVMLIFSITFNIYSQSIPLGQSQESFQMIDGYTWTVYYYKPANYDSLNSEIIWYIHGQGGNGSDAYSLLTDIAEKRKALIVSPTYPHYNWVYARSGNIWIPYIHAILYHSILQKENRSEIGVRMLGFSGGGQCVTRYMLVRQGINDSIPIKMAISLNPYFYTICTDSLSGINLGYPCGISDNGGAFNFKINCAEHVNGYYNENYTIMIGAADTLSSPTSFSCGNVQGTTRYERALNFYNFSQQNAIERGTTLQWYYAEVPDVGHDGYAMINTKANSTDTVTICEHYLFDMPYHEPQKFPPTADFDYSINDTTQCIEFNADCKCWWQTQPTTYSWVFGNGVTTSGQNISIDLAENGQYNVQLIASNIYGSDTIVKTIEISSFPQANYSISDSVVFLPNANVLFSNQTTNAVSYLWDFGDSIQSNEMSPVHVYQDSGFYSVTLISCNSFGCCDTLIKQNLIEVKNPNSINNLNNNLNNFQIFPNPSNGIVTIKTTNEAIETIEVFNCIGNKTDEIIVKGNNSSYIYNSKNMNGLYFIKVKTRENVYAGKVILQ